MAALERFMAYAADFEKTFEDDDWTRLEPYFADDAVYEIRSAAPERMRGKQAIFAGIKKSLDGFDRRMQGRHVALGGEPKADEDAFEVSWTVTYTKDGAPPLPLRGHTVARFENGVIVEMADSYDDAMMAETAAWIARHAPGCDPSYT